MPACKGEAIPSLSSARHGKWVTTGRAQRGSTPATPVIDNVRASSYRIPLEVAQSDGTLAWEHTSVVVAEARAGSTSGLGYSYGSEAAARVIDDTLAGEVGLRGRLGAVGPRPSPHLRNQPNPVRGRRGPGRRTRRAPPPGHHPPLQPAIPGRQGRRGRIGPGRDLTAGGSDRGRQGALRRRARSSCRGGRPSPGARGNRHALRPHAFLECSIADAGDRRGWSRA